MVAHRPSALAEIDKLLWLDNGAVRAFGSKAEVLPRLTGAPPAGGDAASRIRAVNETA